MNPFIVNDFPVLTALILVPFVGAVGIAFLPNRRPDAIRAVTFATMATVLGLAGFLVAKFPLGTAGFVYRESHSWLPTLGVRYSLGIDGISLFVVLLTALLFPISMLASTKISERPKSFAIWMLVLEAASLGVFLATDLILFFIFFELVLVPMYFIIGGWGHGRRVYAAMKFFVYTMAGSAFLLVGILAIGFLRQADGHALSFSYEALRAWAPKGLDSGTAKWLFLAFFAAFAVKVPLVPFHTWLPDAHTEAPTAGSVILAGVLLKMGTYGFLRFSLAFFPQASVDLVPFMMTLSVIGIIYGAVVATMQPDLKRLVAYSSVAHMGFVILGIFSITVQGIQGGIVTMVSHGLTTGALFLLIGFIYERRHTRKIADLRGLWRAAPVLGGLTVIAVFASIGLPGFSGFIGEFLSLLGAFLSERPFAVVAATGVILAAIYLLWAFQRAFTGRPEGDNATMADLNARELCAVVPLLLLSLFLGLYPKPLLDRIEPAVQRVVVCVEGNTNYRAPKIDPLKAPELAATAVDGGHGTADGGTKKVEASPEATRAAKDLDEVACYDSGRGAGR